MAETVFLGRISACWHPCWTAMSAAAPRVEGIRYQEVLMTPEIAAQTAGEAPLDDLVGAAEEDVRQLADLLSGRGALDTEAAGLLADIRARLLVAVARLRVLG